MKLVHALLAATLLLGGCENTPLIGGGSIAQSQPGISLKTEQALTVAHLAYNGLSQEILLAVKSGVLHGNNAAQVKIYYDKAGDALRVADKADKALNETGVLTALSTANEALSMAKKLVGV